MKKFNIRNMIREEVRKYLYEIKRPPGFSSVDIESIEDFIGTNLKEANLPSDVEYTPVDAGQMMSKKLSGEKDKEVPYIHSSNIIGDDGKPIDLTTLKNLITIKPDHILERNEKIKHSGGKTWIFYNISLPAYKGLFYDEADGVFKIINVCRNAGACKVYCYARQGGYIQWKASSLKSTRTVNFLFNHWDDFKNKVVSEINEAYNKNKQKDVTTVIRWHDSGDFVSGKYLDMAYDIARATPEVIHYAYTKMVELVSKSNIPKNFVFNFSVGGTQDTLVDPKIQKHSKVVPSKYFTGLITQYMDGKIKKYKFNSQESYNEFKKIMSDRYDIPEDTIITYEELMKMPYNRNQDYTPKWNVIVYTGDGDDAAARKDVLGVYLLIH